MASRPILLYFPQWQGTGLTTAVQTGTETLLSAFSDVQAVDVPLSDEPLTIQHGISGYQPLVTQLKTANAILERLQPDRLLLLAGDCAAEIAPIHYLNNRYNGELMVLWLDAHADLNTPQSSPSGHFHGMPLRLLLDGQFPDTAFRIDTPLGSQQILFVGLRETDTAEAIYIEEQSLSVVTDTAFSQQQVIDLIAGRTTRPLYIHLDLDILDPILFPALQYPTPGGVSPETIARFIGELIRTHTVVGLSLTETTATNKVDLQPIQSILTEYRHWLLHA